MARVYSGKRPQNLKRTLGAVSRYLGRHRVLIALVAVLAALSASANLLGTYMIRPIVNQVVAQGSVSGLMAGVGITAAIYGRGRPVHPGLHPDHGPGGPENSPGHPPGPVPPLQTLPCASLTRTGMGT